MPMPLSIRRRLLLACAALPWLALSAGAQSIEVLTLRHRTADDVLPLLQPFVEPGGALTGRGNQLIVRVSPANLRQLRDLLATLDRAPRQLLITVRQDRASEESQQGLRAGGGVVIDSRRGGGSNSSGSVTIESSNSRTVTSRNTGQSIRVLEGGRATIDIGTAIPFTFRQYVAGPQGLTALDTTTFIEAVTGFAVRPLLSGEVVTLELAPVDATISARSGALERAQLMTRMQGRLGEWIAVGDADLREQAQRSGSGGTDARLASSTRGVWVKVEAVD
jgi:hypothetical protein